MQGWAKGLKDRVERTATQLSHVSTAFIPPEDGVENGVENGNNIDEQNGNNIVGETKQSSDGAGHAGATAVPGTPSGQGMFRVYSYSTVVIRIYLWCNFEYACPQSVFMVGLVTIV